MKNYLKLIFAVSFIFILTGCNEYPIVAPASGCSIVSASVQETEGDAGQEKTSTVVRLKVRNEDARDISQVIIVCGLFEEKEGRYVFKENFMARNSCLIEAGKTAEFICNIDSLVNEKRKNYAVGNSYVRKIVYSDGSVWLSPVSLYLEDSL